MAGSVQTRFPRWVQTLESPASAPAHRREQQGLVDASFQERRKAAPIRRRGPLGAVDQLPAAREHAFPYDLEEGGIAVPGGRECSGPADVFVDHRAIVSQLSRGGPAWMNRCFDGSDARAVDPAAESVRTFPEPGQKAASPVSLAGVAAHPLVLAGAWVACVLLLHAIVAAVHYRFAMPTRPSTRASPSS